MHMLMKLCFRHVDHAQLICACNPSASILPRPLFFSTQSIKSFPVKEFLWVLKPLRWSLIIPLFSISFTNWAYSSSSQVKPAVSDGIPRVPKEFTDASYLFIYLFILLMFYSTHRITCISFIRFGNQGIALGKPMTICRLLRDLSKYRRRGSQHELDVNQQRHLVGVPSQISRHLHKWHLKKIFPNSSAI